MTSLKTHPTRTRLGPPLLRGSPRWKLLLGTAFLVLLGSPFPACARTVSFNAALNLALHANPHYRIAQADQEAARGRLITSQGRNLPHLALELSAERTNDPLGVLGERLSEGQASFADLGLGDYTGPASLAMIPPALNQPGYGTNYDTGIVMMVPLFESGADQAAIQAARRSVSAAQARVIEARGHLIETVLADYDGVSVARALNRSALAAEAAAKADYQLTGQLYAQGIVLASDLERAKAHWLELKADARAAKARVQNELEAFRSLIGLPLNAPVTPGLAVSPPPLSLTLEAMRERARIDNPGLIALQERTRALSARLDQAEDRRGPQVNLLLRHDWNAPSPSFRGPSNTIAAVVSWRFFNSGSLRGEIDETRARYRASRDALQAGKRHLDLAISELVRLIAVTHARLRASREASREAAKAQHILRLRYRQGLATLNALIHAQARFARAQANTIRFGYGLILAEAALRTDLDDWNPDALHPADPEPHRSIP